MANICITTGMNTVNEEGTVTFPCPNCKETITRSGFARKNALNYKCKCGHEGP